MTFLRHCSQASFLLPLHSSIAVLHFTIQNLAANTCRSSTDGATQLNGGLSGSSSAGPQKAWDIEQGPLDLMLPSADPLLKLGRLPSISETGNSKQPFFNLCLSSTAVHLCPLQRVVPVCLHLDTLLHLRGRGRLRACFT